MEALLIVTLENKSAEKVGTEKDLINGTNNITKIKFQMEGMS